VNADLSLYLVTDSRMAAAAGHDLPQLVRAAADGGVTTVQLREKHAPARMFLDTVLRVAEVLPEHVALIVNDRVDVFLAARTAGAPVAGVHVGQSDLPAEAVRRLVGPDAVVGVSASTEEQLRAAAGPGGVDYVGIGALHATSTKADAPAPLGAERFAELVRASSLPAVAIGGVTAADLPRLRAAGTGGAAVVSAICAATDPRAAARELRAAWEGR
jgi:thiamine-phosphate pyrophosphorylase